MINRRRMLQIASALAFTWADRSFAQQQAKQVRIGWIAVGTPTSRTSLFLDAVKLGLRDLGYIEGRNLVIEARWVEPSIT